MEGVEKRGMGGAEEEVEGRGLIVLDFDPHVGAGIVSVRGCEVGGHSSLRLRMQQQPRLDFVDATERREDGAVP